VIFDDWDRWTAINTQFNTDVAAYEVDRAAYNAENALQEQKNTDKISGLLMGPVTIPARPCKPDRPALYSGPTLEHTTKWAAFTTSDRASGKAALKLNSAADVVQNAFMEMSGDTSVATT